MLTGKLPPLDPTRRYTVKETVAILGVCRKTLWKYTRSHDLVAGVHAPSGQVYYTGRAIEEFYYKTI